MYKTLFKDLGVTIPFDAFTVGVLRILEVAPSQLHPNGWAAMKAFRVVSLSPLPKGSLFNVLALYKGFKNHFVRVVAVGNAPFSTNSEPLPLYWRFTSKFKGFNRKALSPKEKFNLSLLEERPRGMSYKELVAISFDSHPSKLFSDLLKQQEFGLYLLMQRSLKKRGLAVGANS
ncbi:hypothetical protein CR513_60705, partial [Mucuna pruriens]